MKEYVLSNDCLRLRVLSAGATITSMAFKKGDQWYETTLRYDDPTLYQGANPYYLNAVIGPHAGRIKAGRYTLNQQVIELECNENGNHLHGGSHGFHTLDFVGEKGDATLTLRAFDAYHQIDVVVTMHLEERDVVIAYQATPRIEQVVNMTQHTYFNLSGEPTIANHALHIAANEVTLLERASIPTPTTLAVEDTPFDFNLKRPIGDVLAMDHSQFAISKHIDHPYHTFSDSGVVLESNLTNIGVRVTSDALCTVVYLSNYFGEDVHFANHQPAQMHQAVAIEPQDLPNDVNLHTARSQIFGPNKPFTRTIRYHFYSLD